MTDNILKILSTGASVMQNASKVLVQKGQEIIEDNILKGKYVTREEYLNLQARLAKLQQEIETIKLEKKNK